MARNKKGVDLKLTNKKKQEKKRKKRQEKIYKKLIFSLIQNENEQKILKSF